MGKERMENGLGAAHPGRLGKEFKPLHTEKRGTKKGQKIFSRGIE